MGLNLISVIREFQLVEGPWDRQTGDNLLFDSYAYGPHAKGTRFTRGIADPQTPWENSCLLKDGDQIIGSGEDPRAFYWQDSPCISAASYSRGHGQINKIYVERQKRWITLIAPRKLKPGKNWAPFVKDDELYFVHAYSPFRVLKARFLNESDHFMVLDEVADHPIRTPRSFDNFSMFRGGSNGLQLGSQIVGVGHTNERLDRSAESMVHRPFLFVYEPNETLTYYGFEFDFPEKYRIVDPTSLFMKEGKLHLVTCETEFIWDRTPQRGRSCLYQLSIPGESDENGIGFRGRRLYRWSHGETSKVRRILGAWRRPQTECIPT